MRVDKESIVHPIAPVYDKNSRILILGSFPSVLSRKEGFFYGNPQNRFWAVMAAVLDTELPQTVEEKKTMLLEGRVALFDAAKACRIRGSADATMTDAVPADLRPILRAADIRRVFVNGRQAERIMKETGIETEYLPSTSPANARMNLTRLVAVWKEKLDPYLLENKESRRK